MTIRMCMYVSMCVCVLILLESSSWLVVLSDRDMHGYVFNKGMHACTLYMHAYPYTSAENSNFEKETTCS